MRRGLVVALVWSGCANGRDVAAPCRADLAAKRDATKSCEAVYRDAKSPQTAKLAVDAWEARGVALREAGNTKESIAAFSRALELRDPSDLRGRNNDLAALSERYTVDGDLRRALFMEAQELELAHQISELGVAHVSINLASDLFDLGDVQGADRVLGQIPAQLHADDGYLPIATLLQGEIYWHSGRLELARIALERTRALGDHARAREATLDLIDVALDRGDVATAAVLIAGDHPKPSGNSHASHAWYAARVALASHKPAEAAQILDDADAAKPPGDWQWQLDTLRGEVLEQQGDLPGAAAAYERAVSQVEAARDDLELDELKAWAERERRAPYEQLFALHARAGRAGAALAVANRASARSFVDGLAATTTPVAATDSAAELAERAGVKVESLRAIAHSLRSSPTAKLPEADALAHALADRVVWTYFVAAGRVWLVALDRGVATVDDLGAMAKLAPLVEQAAGLDEAALQQLGAVLCPHRRLAALDPSRTLHLAVDHALDRVPFAALVVDGHRMVEHASLAYVPSAAVLAMLGSRDRADGAVVVLGDARGDLPGARAEATATASRFGVTAQLGAAATSAALFAAADARLLAVASHASITPGGATLTLADRDVTAAEILEHHLAPRLAILSSCTSAAVDKDAWGALAGAFLAAGTPTVLASRWAVDDALERGLVADVLAAGDFDHLARALAMAQRTAIARHFPTRAWAALVVIGLGDNPQQESTQR